MSLLSDFGFWLPNKHTPDTLLSGKEMHHHRSWWFWRYQKPCGSSVDDYKFYLQVIDFSVHTVKWNSTVELQRKVHDELDRVRADCYMLVVSVMSHGSYASLEGSDGSELPVNDLLHQLIQSVCSQVPMVGTSIGIVSYHHSYHCYLISPYHLSQLWSW